MFQSPYIIGDRLNTSNCLTKQAVGICDLSTLAAMGTMQIVNGAHAIDVTACASGPREQQDLHTILQSLRPAGKIVCSIDTQDPKLIAEARSRLAEPPILNCYSGLLDSLPEMQEAIRSAFPIAGVIAVCIDFAGANVMPARRLDIAKRMAAELTDAGVASEQIIFDPVTMPTSAGPKAEQVTLDTIRLLRHVFPNSGVLCAVSNYSYGLTKRRMVEREYVKRAKSYGATVFLLNALDEKLCATVRGTR